MLATSGADLARLVKVEVLKTVGTAVIETARNGFLIVAILIVLISDSALDSK